ncbi:MAG: response regulator [Pseudomonadota bacterium]|uniref:response regulator n=1 Tax=Polaromonas sp. TaxID=1869339 RepID=UPI0017B847C5|nr:response regulator [Polaromonas sp.]MBA3595321.1 response regulator [Polaromonas sp.]MDQ3271343.1 response regulator [Pseudomonadota bacterium]
MNEPVSGFRQAAAEPEFGLAEAQRRMQRQLMVSTGVAQAVFDLASQELNWNPRAYEIYGVDAATPLSLDFAMGLVYPDDLDLLIRAREQLRRSPGAIELDYRIIRADGELVDIHSLLFSEVDSQGRPLLFVELSLDVTERKRVETALIQSARLCRVLDKVSTDIYWEQSDDRDASDTQPAPLESAHGSGEELRKMRVLYVEDNMYNLMLFDDVMRTREDVEMRMAQNGAQGFEVASSWQPDVLVIDGRLPDIHGIDLLQRMRAIPGLENTPAFMCSADTLPEHKILAEQAGFTGYWTKPVDFDKVFEELDRIVAGSALR